MKRILQALLLLLISSCSSYQAESEEESPVSTSPVPVTLKVRSNSPESLSYPISVFIFHKNGQLIHQSEIQSASTPFKVQLSPGEYRLSAFSGLNSEQYERPKEPSATSVITPVNHAPNPTPLQHGQSSFILEKKTELSIHLAYIVSSLEFKFHQIPEDATEVKVGISPVSKGYSFDGTYTNDKQSYTLSCKRIEDSWEAGPVYTFPSSHAQTTLTLYIQRPSGTETLSYTYQYQLQPAQPYRFSGTYQGSFDLSGIFEIEGWKPGIDVEFDFVENGKENPLEPEGPTEEDSSIAYADHLPIQGEFWNDFYVWKAEPINGYAVKATLISPQQWFNVLASEGQDLLSSYKVNGYTNWRVFTKEEARSFYSDYGNQLPQLNQQLRSHGQDEFYFYEGERYLCDECRYTFNLYGNMSIRKAGEKTKYYLRGIKTLIVKKR